MDARQILEKIIGLEHEIMNLQDKFDDAPQDDRREALTTRFDALQRDTGENDEVPMEFIRVAQMIAPLEGGAALLATGMSHSNDDLRHLCGEALLSIADEDGVGAIVPAVDYALDKKDISAKEMPFVLGYIEDPAALTQIHRFLKGEDPEIVYLAIEACANIGDSASLEALRKLENDEREIEVDEEEEGPITIGMLAQEAIGLIEADEE